MSDHAPSTWQGGVSFHTTQWGVVRAAGGALDESATLQAREALCRMYWKPVWALLVARGVRPADAEDLTQDFFKRLLEGDRLTQVRADGGKFRIWLRKSVEHWRISAHRKRVALKRGGGAEHEEYSEQEHQGEHPRDAMPSHFLAFDRAWALAAFDGAIEALRTRYTAEAQRAHFEALLPVVLPAGSTLSGEELAAELRVGHAAARKALERFRRRFREALRREIALTVTDPEQVTEELRYLRDVLGATVTTSPIPPAASRRVAPDLPE